VETLASSLRGAVDVPWENVFLLRGDMREPDLGLGSDIPSRLREVTEIIHLARPRAGEVAAEESLVQGVDGVIELARRLPRLRRLVVLSSTEVVGDYRGRFYEDWLDVGQNLPAGRPQTLLEVEQRAREAADYLPLVVARHAVMVGHSQTGQMECDGTMAQLLAWAYRIRRLPGFVHVPIPAPGARFFSITPVDFLAAGMAELALNGGVEGGETFCLADPHSPSLAELFELLLDRVGAPAPGMRLAVEPRGPVGLTVATAARVGRWVRQATGREGGPWTYLLQRGEHDVTNAQRVLTAAGIACPRLPTYFDALYEDYCRRRERYH
jgi:nucleoside-diphosphate-sugar epimerase